MNSGSLPPIPGGLATLGMMEAIGTMNMLCERSLEFGYEVFFVDFEETFYIVNWMKILDILRLMRVDWRDRRLIKTLYIDQKAVVIVNELMTTYLNQENLRKVCKVK